MRELAHRIVHARRFEYLLVILIIGSAVLLGLATSDYLLDQFGIWIELFLILALTMLVLEVLLKMFALLPRIDRYFRDGWNVFDFLAISFVIVSITAASADVAGYGILIIFISVRLLRLLRGFSTAKDMRELAHRIVHARRFEYLLVILIIGSAVLLGLATSDYLLDQFNIWMGLFLILALTMLVLEVLLKMFALLPRIDRYFRDGWNVFDFLAISFVIVSIAAAPADIARYGILIISVRLLRLLRGFSTVKELRTVLSTLFRSIPSLGHIVVLMSLIIYVYALVGYWSFEEHDPARWGNLGVAASSLFQILTLDDWVVIMKTVTEAVPFAWIYFVSFVILSAFVVANVFIAIVINNLDDERQERLRTLETPASREEILRELRSTQQAFQRLEERLQQLPE